MLVTGLALGAEVGVCQACNLDFDWLIQYPSVLAWSDQILIPTFVWKLMHQFGELEEDESLLCKAVTMILDRAHQEGIVETFDPADYIPKEAAELILKEVAAERKVLLDKYPARVKPGDEESVPGELYIDGTHYCSPSIATIHAGLLVAKTVGASCLFDDMSLRYCQLKFEIQKNRGAADHLELPALSSVFSAYLPNEPVLPSYFGTPREKCSLCIHEAECKSGFWPDLQQKIDKTLELRDFDELHLLKEAISSIMREARKEGAIEPDHIRAKLSDKEHSLRRIMRRYFPKVRRWANVVAVVSSPVAVAGLVTSDVRLVAAGGAGLGLSQAVREALELLSNKWSWIGFRQKLIDSN